MYLLHVIAGAASNNRLGCQHMNTFCPACRLDLTKQVREHKLANPRPDERQVAKLPLWKKPIMTDLANLILRALLKEHKCL